MIWRRSRPEHLDAHDAVRRRWEETYNNFRPHQALHYVTPNDYVVRRRASRKPIIWGRQSLSDLLNCYSGSADLLQN
jgi:transposase InsO family protein